MKEHIARLLESTNAFTQELKKGDRLTSLQLMAALDSFLRVYEARYAPELAANRKRMKYSSAAAELGRLGG